MKGLQTLSEGVPYRVNQLVEILGKSRPTVEKYIKRFSLEKTVVEHNGKAVQAVVLTAENIDQIARGSETVYEGDQEPFGSITEAVSLTDHEPFTKDDNLHPLVLQERLRAADEKIESLKELLAERERLVLSKESEIEAKQSEINTLKTSMLILESKHQDKKQDKPIELVPSSQGKGILGRLKDFITGG